jgi:hypothetical protein
MFRLQGSGRKKAAAAAKWRSSGFQVNPAFIIVVVVKHIDAYVAQKQTNESQYSVTEMEGTIIPGHASAQESQDYGKKQELWSGLEKPYFQLHKALSIADRLRLCLGLFIHAIGN